MGWSHQLGKLLHFPTFHVSSPGIRVFTHFSKTPCGNFHLFKLLPFAKDIKTPVGLPVFGTFSPIRTTYHSSEKENSNVQLKKIIQEFPRCLNALFLSNKPKRKWQDWSLRMEMKYVGARLKKLALPKLGWATNFWTPNGLPSTIFQRWFASFWQGGWAMVSQDLFTHVNSEKSRASKEDLSWDFPFFFWCNKKQGPGDFFLTGWTVPELCSAIFVVFFWSEGFCSCFFYYIFWQSKMQLSVQIPIA